MDEIARKNDAAEIAEFLTQLPDRTPLPQDRRWWTQFAFHFTDMQNAVRILETGWLYSRQRLEEMGLPFVDGASPLIIDRTRQEELDYVRLYFRPRTPTQYRNEGIRPIAQRELNAHMPVPVFLLFNIAEILTRADCSFSNQSLARAMFNVGSDCGFLKELPFEDIYHDTYLPSDPIKRDEIVARRHAEIMIPRQLDLAGLREVHCRSAAEKDTLLNLLDQNTRREWNNRIFSDSRRHLFYKKWTYVDSVFLGKNNILVKFSPDTVTPGPYSISVLFQEPNGRTTDMFSHGSVMLNKLGNYRIRLRLPHAAPEYTCSVLLDDILCYSGRFVDYEDPF